MLFNCIIIIILYFVSEIIRDSTFLWDLCRLLFYHLNDFHIHSILYVLNLLSSHSCFYNKSEIITCPFNVSLHIFHSMLYAVFLFNTSMSDSSFLFASSFRTLRSLIFFSFYWTFTLGKGLFLHRNLHSSYHWHIDKNLKLYCPWDWPPVELVFLI